MKKYSAIRFPYQGRRRYTPLMYQSEDGGIIISNDVFGLTIKQFERRFKACLERRNTHKQYILNLRYPDKTSDQYMEYLQNSNEDNAFSTGNDLKKIYLYESLLNTLGTEIDIRNRQQLFIIHDMLHNVKGSTMKRMSSGSLAEGLDLPGSDMDVMFVLKNVDVIQNVRDIKLPVKNTTLLMETDNDHPGFARLRLISACYGPDQLLTLDYFETTRNSIYLSVDKFFSNINQIVACWHLSKHGPCLSDLDEHDFAYCVRSKCLPYSTIPWTTRYRKQWPPNSVINKIQKYGCLFVPVGPRHLSNSNILWRLSFSVAEKHLVHSFNYTQLLCYCLLKLTLKHIVNTNKHAEGLLCSYFLKTALFWVSEEVDIDTLKLSKLLACLSLCLNKLITWVKKCYCPNYFIPEHNMFLGKISPDNNKVLIHILENVQCDGIDGLMKNMYPFFNRHYRVLSKSSILDFPFFRLSGLCHCESMSLCSQRLIFIESLIKSKSSAFIVDVCKYYHSVASQHAAQLLPPPTVTTERYNIHKRYHKHLIDGIKTDAVSGWLLYASFYYVTGQFNVTLSLTDYVLSRCTSDMIPADGADYYRENIIRYTNHVYTAISLSNRKRIATVRNVKFLKNSSIIPGELQVDQINHSISIPPTVLSHFLRFLCYHHLGDFSNRQKVLHDLNLILKDWRMFMRLRKAHALSNVMTMLGVCYEISGKKDKASYAYQFALQYCEWICPTAKEKQSKLFEI